MSTVEPVAPETGDGPTSSGPRPSTTFTSVVVRHSATPASEFSSDEFSVELDPGARTLYLHGELDIAGSAPLLDAAGALIRSRPRANLTLDLSGLAFVDSTGLGAIVQIYNDLTANGARLHLVIPEGNVRQVFTLGGLGQLL